mmetsp:Transcript_88504/g.108360  ORF Transcript_88504/g.108360 Transcript_88504/m.108360 type:complete len:448 (+) Transcript_88504:84-1427(+)
MSALKVFFGLIFKIGILYGYEDSFGTLDPNGAECEAPFQSPINFDLNSLPVCSENNTYPNEIYLNLELRDEKIQNFVVKNDGYSIEVLPFIGNSDNPKQITEIEIIHENTQSLFTIDNPLNITYPYNANSRYCFDSLHFHWGSNDSLGSEHTFDNTQTPLEAHLLCYSCDYHDVREALAAYTGQTAEDKYVIGVIGVLFDVGEANKALDSILKPIIIDRIADYNNKPDNLISYNYAQLNITDLVPGYQSQNIDKSLTSLVMYYGSLTTPPCYETIRWFVMKNKLTVSEEQLNQFRRILNRNNQSSSNNYRDLNPINNRTLYNCEHQIISDQTNKLSSNTNTGNNNDDKKMGALGVIIAVVIIACIILVIIIIVGIWLCRKSHKNSGSIKTNTETSQNYSDVTKNENGNDPEVVGTTPHHESVPTQSLKAEPDADVADGQTTDAINTA